MNFRAGCSELKDLNVQHLSEIHNFIPRCLLLLPLFHASLRRAVGAAALSPQLTKVFLGGGTNKLACRFFPPKGGTLGSFFSIFQELQDPQYFAPLRSQNFRKKSPDFFAKMKLSFSFLQNSMNFVFFFSEF